MLKKRILKKGQNKWVALSVRVRVRVGVRVGVRVKVRRRLRIRGLCSPEPATVVTEPVRRST